MSTTDDDSGFFAAMPQPSGPLHIEEIKAKIRMKCGSLSAFERREKLPAGSVRDALRKPRPEVEKAIAKLIGFRPEQLWPGRFIRRGRQLRSTIVDAANTSLQGLARQKAGAA